MRTIIALACASFIAGAATIQVAPNILVSRESGLPKVELTVAANPKNAKNLIGTGIAATPFTEGCTVYTSFDGGYSWKPVVPPGLPETGSGDPQVLFTDDGTAYFSALGLIREETGRQRFVDFLFRSRDGGLTWDKIATFGAGTGPDHDMLVADSAGRVFISLVYQQGGESNIGVYRLEPGGSAVTGPVRVATGAGAAVFTWNPVVFSDGSLFVPFQVFSGPVTKSPVREIFAAASRDGGATFSAAKKIGSQRLDLHNPVNPYGNVAFAVDTRSVSFRNRLYMLWNDASGAGGYRLRLAISTDMGLTWSAAHDIDARVAPRQNAFRPAIAVNRAGVVGISWLDTRDSATGRTYREYFTASLDGGETFLPPVVVSSAESSLDAVANYAVHPTIDSPRAASDGNIEFSFMSTLGRFPDGGDYMGLTEDGIGTFHPFWVDTRTGSDQVWTAAVRVESRSGPATSQPIEDDPARQLRPLFDPASYDPETGTENIPIRLQNSSDVPVCAPLRVTLHDPETAPHPTPRVLNADNHREWDGASFDYTPAFRDLSCLAPGEITEAIIWRVRPLASEATFVTMRVSITHDSPKQ